MIEFGDWQIRRGDALNLKLFHRHEKKGRGKNANADDNGELGWFDTGNYFYSVRDAVMFAAKHDMRRLVGDDDEWLTLAEYVSQITVLLNDFRDDLSGVTGRP